MYLFISQPILSHKKVTRERSFCIFLNKERVSLWRMYKIKGFRLGVVSVGPSVVSDFLRPHPMDCSPPGSSVHGVLQARILEWVPIPFSTGSSQPRTEPPSPALHYEPPGEPRGSEGWDNNQVDKVDMFLCTNFWWTSSVLLVQGRYLSQDLFWEEEQVCKGMQKEGIRVIFLLLPFSQTPSAWAIFYPRVLHFEKLYPKPHAQLTLPHLLLLPETTATCTVLHPLSLVTTPPKSGDHRPSLVATPQPRLSSQWPCVNCECNRSANSFRFLSLDLHPPSPNHTQGNKVIW